MRARARSDRPCTAQIAPGTATSITMSPRSERAQHVLELGQPPGEIDHRRGERLPPRERQQLPGEALAALRSRW